MMTRNTARWWLIPYYCLLYLLPLGFGPLGIPDEARYAEISREMLARGDWIVPKFLGLRYFEKPIAGYWWNNIFHWLFGESHFSVRLGVAVATGLTAGLIYFFTRRVLRSERKAVWATFGYLSCLEVLLLGTHATLDPMLTLWLVAAMVCFWFGIQAAERRGKLIAYGLFGAACGVAFLTKGFVALAIPVVALVPFMLLQKRLRELIVYGLWSVLIAALVAAPWAVAVYIRESDYWHYFFWVENIKRFSGDHAQHQQPFWFYLPVMLVGVLPWIGLLPGALCSGWRDRANRQSFQYLALWVGMPFLLLSIAHGKLPTYVLPLFAPLAILAASGMVDRMDSGHARGLRINAGLNLGIAALGLLAVIWLQMHPPHGKPYYGPGQTLDWLLLVFIFALWCGAAAWNLWRPARGLPALLAAVVGMSVVLPLALPNRLVEAKFPDRVLAAHQALLADATAIGVNDVGMAADTAWVARRSDLTMLGGHGELRYGLAYPDARGRWVAGSAIADWVARQRRQGTVVIIWREGSYGSNLELPDADSVIQRGRLEIRVYNQSP